MRPLFSIVIPTRDRPNLLKDAIQSALNQEFDDYEIIVSDNSTNSETQKLVSEFESKKIKYFRTPRLLDMPKSWEFALYIMISQWGCRIVQLRIAFRCIMAICP